MRNGLAFLLAALVLSAGCLGDDPKAAKDGDPLTSAPPATANETTGGIQGLVVTDEGLPAAGVKLGLLEAPVETTSDREGAFSFSNLEPRTYRVAYERFGFKSGTVEAKVSAGEITDLEIQLQASAAPKPYNRTERKNGHIASGAMGSGDIYDGQCQCGFDFTANKSLKTMIIEMSFTPTIQGPNGNTIWVDVYSKEDWDNWDPLAPPTYASQRMGPGDQIRLKEVPSKANWSEPSAFHIQAFCDVDWVCYEQDFTLVVTFFYVKEAPESFTALA